MSATTDFVWPAAYRALRDDGRFDYWGAPYASLSEAQKEARAEGHQHRVLWWGSIEWKVPPSERFRDWMRPELVPFAKNGWGDQFCFYPRWQDGPEPPVVLWRHDEQDSELWVRSFSELLLRHLLLEQIEWSDEYDGDEALRRELYRAHRSIVLPHLAATDRAVLLALGDEPTPRACEAAEREIARSVGVRRLRGMLPPERYAEELPHLRDRHVLADLYARDADFLRELVEDEGHEALRPRLELARAHLARVRG